MPRRSVSNSGSRSPPRKARAPRRSPTPTRSPPKTFNNEEQQLKLYVSGLPPHANKDDLRSHFQEFGSITDIFVVNKQAFSFGFVTYDNPKSASEAKEAMAGKEIGGKTISCAYARPRPERSNGPRGGGGGGSGAPKGRGCFKCGEEGHFARDCPKGDPEGSSRPPRRQFNSRNQGNNRQGDRNRNNARSVSNSNSPKRKNNPRKRSPSESPAKKRQQGRKSRSGSSSPTKSPPKRRTQRKSSSRSQSPKKRAPRHSRSRSAELRKGNNKRRVSPSSSGSRKR